MEKSALVLLAAPREQRLLAAWKALPPRELDENDEVQLWAAAAGVEASCARRNRVVFLANSICGQDTEGRRWIADLAEKYVFVLAVEAINENRGKAPKKGGTDGEA